MKKTLSIVLALVIALSCSAMAFAETTTATTTTKATTVYTCPSCKASYYDVEDYNDHLATHNSFTCPTCKKMWNTVDEYNACIESHRIEDSGVDKFEYAIDKYFSSKTVYEVIDTLVSYFKDTGILDQIKSYIDKVVDFIEAWAYDKAGVAGAVADLESKVAELGLGEDSTIKSLINGLKQKIKDLYAGERATVEEVTEAEAPAETGSSSLGICAFAAVSVACAAAFVCTKKKD